jgi:hypothetical protein
MARQEDTCWCCGGDWASEAEQPTRLRVIPGARADAEGPPAAVLPRTAAAGA